MFRLILLSALSLAFLLKTLFRMLNLRRPVPDLPEELLERFDQATIEKSLAYTKDQARLAIFEEGFGLLVAALFLYTPLFPALLGWVQGATPSPVMQAILFFLITVLAQSLLGIPFAAIAQFRIENRYGFNRMGAGLFFADIAKSIIISTVLLGLLLWGLFSLAYSGLTHWYLPAWGAWFLFSIVLSLLYPVLIAPLFNRFQPLQDQELGDKIRTLMEQAGIKLGAVLQMDATRRSTHSNAYFTGMGATKRIVLFDTLLERLEHKEILSVLAHEAGHWKKHHVWKQLLMSTLSALFVLALIAWLVRFNLEGIGLPNLLWLKLWFFAALFGPVELLLEPLGSWLSRRHEREADAFAVELTGTSTPLRTSLVKLAADNLSHINPHPLVWKWSYSHPPLLVRLARLKALAADMKEP